MGNKKVIISLIILLAFFWYEPAATKLFHSPHDNFHEVEKNAFFRSKQLSPKKLEKFIKQFGIKTIINLRGKNEDKKWWRQEKEIAKQLNIGFYSIPMSAQRLPHKKDLITLLNLYKHAPRPILIHCLAGADRTGEAAAIWVLDQQKKSKKDALKQLSFTYGHFSFIRPSKKFFIKKLWKGRKWAETKYNPFLYPKHYKFKAKSK